MGHDGLRLVVELARGEADRKHAGGPEPHVAAAVALERGAVAVERPAVDLDGDALVGPVRVDLALGDEDVGLGQRQARLPEQREELPLGRGLRAPRRAVLEPSRDLWRERVAFRVSLCCDRFQGSEGEGPSEVVQRVEPGW